MTSLQLHIIHKKKEVEKIKQSQDQHNNIKIECVCASRTSKKLRVSDSMEFI